MADSGLQAKPAFPETGNQLALIKVESTPTLTERQAYALEHVQHAGTDGITADEVGALLCARNGKHDAGDRCLYDAQNGNEILRALRSKGLVRYRIRTGWVTKNPIERDELPPGMSDEIPF